MGALQECHYPTWALNRLKLKNNTEYNTSNNNKPNKNKEDNIYLVVPYTKGLSESLKNICNMYSIQVYFKGGNNIKNLLVAPRIKTPSHRKVEDIQVQVWQGRVWWRIYW